MGIGGLKLQYPHPSGRTTPRGSLLPPRGPGEEWAPVAHSGDVLAPRDILYQLLLSPFSISGFLPGTSWDYFPSKLFAFKFLSQDFSLGKPKRNTGPSNIPSGRPHALRLSPLGILAIDLEPGKVKNSFSQQPWWRQHPVFSRHQ